MTRRIISRAAASAMLALTAAVPMGCASPGSGPYAPQLEAHRNPIKAQSLTQQAGDCMERDPTKAARLLAEALRADLYYGPAHNNLGVLYLKQTPSRLYEAAGEFEWARKLMPGHPDPRMNLALVLERAGRVDEALSTYATALEVYPDYLPALQAIACLQLRRGRADDRTDSFLKEIALRGETDRWRDWARRALSRHERHEPALTPPASVTPPAPSSAPPPAADLSR